jgi:hypothetical protein
VEAELLEFHQHQPMVLLVVMAVILLEEAVVVHHMVEHRELVELVE